MTLPSRARFAEGRYIAIGVCTFRRASVFDTLDSLTRLALPPECRLSVIVADNDEVATQGAALAAFGAARGLDIHYVHAPARNISIARNACLATAEAALGADFLAFIDDDETASPDWIARLLAAWAESGAAVVFGPARAIYPPGTPGWLVANDPHSNVPLARGGVVETGHCSNVLLDLGDARVRAARFDPAFGKTGGEDTDFFFRLHRQGVPMTIELLAEVSEQVAPARLARGWLMRRRFWNGQVYGYCVTRSQRQAGAGERARLLVMALGKSSYCLARAGLSAFRASGFWFWAMRASFHFGVAAGAVSRPRTANYGGE